MLVPSPPSIVRTGMVEPVAEPASSATLYGVPTVQVTERLVVWSMLLASTPVVPKSSGFAEMEQSS